MSGKHQEMTWQAVANIDPYLAGGIAAREWQWWDEMTAEQEAANAGLTGDCRADFLRGWHDEIAEQEQERNEQLVKERDDMLEDDEGLGDPAAS
jgi:hypothetical protein